MLKINYKKWYEKLISLNGEPHAIASGLAIGVFIGITPTIPFHTLLIVTLCILLKKNITAGFLGSWFVSNPMTIPFLYVFQYRLGKCLLGRGSQGFMPTDYSLIAIVQQGGNLALPLLAGGLIMATFFAVPAYFIAHKIVASYRKHLHECSEKTS